MGSAARAEALSPQTTSRPLRAWQQAALERYEEQSPKDFLVTATPGAGQDDLRADARRAAARPGARSPASSSSARPTTCACSGPTPPTAMGIVLDPGLTNAVGPVRAGTQGYVTTYAQVAGKPMLHAARATAVKTLVILDEVHHAGDGLSWGEAAEEAFGRAARRLCLTGTPFRTKPDERIPFVRYEEDSFEGDDGERGSGWSAAPTTPTATRRRWPTASSARSSSPPTPGTSRWRNSAGEVVAASLSEAGTKSVEMQAWRTALDPKGQWVPHVIAAMDDRITHLRENGMPDAAGLVLASDQDDARAYAKIVRRVTGKAAELILSDDPKASKKIERFATGSARIAVCVRMISEGVDVPRAAVLAWMTSYRTPLFFAQAVGRVVRSRAPHESATVFLPGRPPAADAGRLDGGGAQPRHAAAEDGGRRRARTSSRCRRKEKDPDGLPQWEALEADARFAHVLHSGTAHTGEGSGPGGRWATRTRSSSASPACSPRRRPRSCCPSGTTSCGCGSPRATGTDAERLLVVEDHPDEDDAGRSWRDAAELRREINRLVNRVAAKTVAAAGRRAHAAARSRCPGRRRRRRRSTCSAPAASASARCSEAAPPRSPMIRLGVGSRPRCGGDARPPRCGRSRRAWP